MSLGQRISLRELLQSLNIPYTDVESTKIFPEEVDSLAKRVAEGFEEFLCSLEPVINKLGYNITI